MFNSGCRARSTVVVYKSIIGLFFFKLPCICLESGKCQAVWPQGSWLAYELWQDRPWAWGADSRGQQSLAQPGILQLSLEERAGTYLPKMFGGVDGGPQKGLEPHL